MKVFVSGRISETELANEAQALFKAAGMKITHDWTKSDAIGDKLENETESGLRAKRDIEGVVDADIYVLLSHNESAGKGMYAELGAALALNQIHGAPQVYIVGPMNHLSIFYLHPTVRRFDTIDEVISDIRSSELPSAA